MLDEEVWLCGSDLPPWAWACGHLITQGVLRTELDSVPVP